MEKYIREPFNGLSHLFGAILGVFALIAMIMKGIALEASGLTITALVLFGVSMILLYASSATYHMVIAKDHVIHQLRRLDHSMIYLLIAGTYAPFCLIALKGTTGYTLFSIISIMAVSGILFKMIWFNCPRWISTALYIGMGWIIVILASPLAGVLGTQGLFFLILGGIFYTIGGVIYGIKPNIPFIKKLGFHEIFHIFILLGTISHFICVFVYVI
ncbi:PAQR family membrane homeostasis protein TrhA [Psychrobacillus lasiicapitis]|uniref:Hemolysin III family protein n=1 Tax=Psychrobacillus lasiicapitis TaxID=1636719 RepID=A0A544TH98_9BACI|nr:hemolysin III family protein [Psychrobacillus lasiicapitis]TQR16842.1 hemolysin III family protein [Psychrobacillus lasiicapitis]GGA26704.1 hemolysin III [Psychrobacillus lasiicapitis]